MIDDTLKTYAPVGAPATWVLSSHDETRLASRYGRKTTSSRFITDGFGEPVDFALGTKRAKAAAMLMLALPGCAYIYQGEELGLPQIDDLPEEVLQDPIFFRSGGEMRGRDGCRVPLPWEGSDPPYGFSPPGTSTWLPQPGDWARFTAEAESADPDSMLNLYRDALRLRREIPACAARSSPGDPRHRTSSTSIAVRRPAAWSTSPARPTRSVPAGPSRWPAHR